MPREIPVQAVFMSAQDHAAMAGKAGFPPTCIPRTPPEPLARVMRHVEWRGAPGEEPAELRRRPRRGRAAAVIAEALADGGGWLGIERDRPRCSTATGSRCPEWRLAADSEAAGRAAEELGGRVALKAQSARRSSTRPRSGAVRIGLAGGEEVAPGGRGDGRSARAAPASSGRASSSRRWSRAASSCWSAWSSDPLFGPVLACGAGGTQAELLKDVAVRICPLDRTTRRARCSARSRSSRC